MHRFTQLALLMIVVFMVAQPASAQSFYFEVEGGATSDFWFTSDDDDNEEGVGHALDHETEATLSWTVGGTFGFRGRDFCGLNLAIPRNNVPELQNSLEPNNSAVSGFNGQSAFIQLAGLQNPDGPDSPLLVKILSGLRLEYQHRIFYGGGVAIEPFAFIGPESGQVSFAIGDKFQYKTEFEDWYLTLLGFQPSNFYFRLGLYQSKLEKPHETATNFVNTTDDLVIAPSIEGKGAFVQAGTNHFGGRFRVGRVDFKSQSDSLPEILGGSGSFSVLIDLFVTPDIVLLSSKSGEAQATPRLSLQPAFGFMFRADYMDPIDGEAWSADGELSMDILVNLGLQAIWRF